MNEILDKFGVDWKLLLAQGINFFILFFILKKFVYGPIVSILRKRKTDIEKGIDFTRLAEENLKNADETKSATIKDAKDKALSIVAQAEASADLRKAEMLKDAAAKRDNVVAEARTIIDEHKGKMIEGAYSEAEGFLRLALEKVLGRMPVEERDRELIKDALKEARVITNNANQIK
ncbi:MAG: ATP synthase F0 subunit B [Candidatus Colwellbacteria bacterium RIFCSPLOWO2_01_FULL_48_10]|uniref:ATP synthase subunit b n=2 Tax=Bacteria candidate phyla TaxID=1783234 RepID=A0A1F5P1A4_9BACT|nr:MAG: ATP synthase F0 subunit B [Candidatus Doudnabacteria bacterium RIFCSPHIGHO2_01_FULL_49_9]OGY60367.1 MAG: ATP synthase F0 subunit B [Candidatus Colwellbacteria bacterium RIFCSPLOWO2_01_FULL_48_10]